MRRVETVAVRLARLQTWSQMPLRFLRLKSSKRSYTIVGEALRRHAGSIPLDPAHPNLENLALFVSRFTHGVTNQGGSASLHLVSPLDASSRERI